MSQDHSFVVIGYVREMTGEKSCNSSVDVNHLSICFLFTVDGKILIAAESVVVCSFFCDVLSLCVYTSYSFLIFFMIIIGLFF